MMERGRGPKGGLKQLSDHHRSVSIGHLLAKQSIAQIAKNEKVAKNTVRAIRDRIH